MHDAIVCVLSCLPLVSSGDGVGRCLVSETTLFQALASPSVKVQELVQEEVPLEALSIYVNFPSVRASGDI